jgi:hypothetical protein
MVLTLEIYQNFKLPNIIYSCFTWIHNQQINQSNWEDLRLGVGRIFHTSKNNSYGLLQNLIIVRIQIKNLLEESIWTVANFTPKIIIF